MMISVRGGNNNIGYVGRDAHIRNVHINFFVTNEPFLKRSQKNEKGGRPMGNLFLKDDSDRADDLIRWGDQLDALGAAIDYLAASDKHEEMDPSIYSALGMIISEYARAVSETATEAFCVLVDFYGNGGSQLTSKLKREIKYVTASGPQSKFDLERIDGALKKITDSLADSLDLMKLQREFLELKKQCLSRINSQEKKEVVSAAKAGDPEN